MLCTVAKQYILQQKFLNKLIGSGPPATRFYNFQPPALTLAPSVLEVIFVMRCDINLHLPTYLLTYLLVKTVPHNDRMEVVHQNEKASNADFHLKL